MTRPTTPDPIREKGGRSTAPFSAFEARIEAATLLIDALAQYMPAGDRRARCADAIKEHLLAPALLDAEAEAATLRPWCRVAIAAALVAAAFCTQAAVSFVGACHEAGVAVPSAWPF